MKKLSALCVIATSASMLYANCGNENCECGDDCSCPQIEMHSEQNHDNPDQQLSDTIKNVLYSSSSDKYNNVNVKVSNSTVVLTGTVTSQTDKDSLEATVTAVSGVQSVDNQVIVQGQ